MCDKGLGDSSSERSEKAIGKQREISSVQGAGQSGAYLGAGSGAMEETYPPTHALDFNDLIETRSEAIHQDESTTIESATQALARPFHLAPLPEYSRRRRSSAGNMLPITSQLSEEDSSSRAHPVQLDTKPSTLVTTATMDSGHNSRDHTSDRLCIPRSPDRPVFSRLDDRIAQPIVRLPYSANYLSSSFPLIATRPALTLTVSEAEGSPSPSLIRTSFDSIEETEDNRSRARVSSKRSFEEAIDACRSPNGIQHTSFNPANEATTLASASGMRDERNATNTMHASSNSYVRSKASSSTHKRRRETLGALRAGYLDEVDLNAPSDTSFATELLRLGLSVTPTTHSVPTTEARIVIARSRRCSESTLGTVTTEMDIYSMICDAISTPVPNLGTAEVEPTDATPDLRDLYVSPSEAELASDEEEPDSIPEYQQLRSSSSGGSAGRATLHASAVGELRQSISRDAASTQNRLTTSEAGFATTDSRDNVSMLDDARQSTLRISRSLTSLPQLDSPAASMTLLDEQRALHRRAHDQNGPSSDGRGSRLQNLRSRRGLKALRRLRKLRARRHRLDVNDSSPSDSDDETRPEQPGSSSRGPSSRGPPSRVGATNCARTRSYDGDATTTRLFSTRVSTPISHAIQDVLASDDTRLSPDNFPSEPPRLPDLLPASPLPPTLPTSPLSPLIGSDLAIPLVEARAGDGETSPPSHAIATEPAQAAAPHPSGTSHDAFAVTPSAPTNLLASPPAFEELIARAQRESVQLSRTANGAATTAAQGIEETRESQASLSVQIEDAFRNLNSAFTRLDATLRLLPHGETRYLDADDIDNNALHPFLPPLLFIGQFGDLSPPDSPLDDDLASRLPLGLAEQPLHLSRSTNRQALPADAPEDGNESVDGNVPEDTNEAEDADEPDEAHAPSEVVEELEELVLEPIEGLLDGSNAATAQDVPERAPSPDSEEVDELDSALNSPVRPLRLPNFRTIQDDMADGEMWTPPAGLFRTPAFRSLQDDYADLGRRSTPRDVIASLSTESYAALLRRRVCPDVGTSYGTTATDSDLPENLDPTCSICLESYSDSDMLMRLPCKHRFHKDCVVTWLKEMTSCPYCRQDVCIAADRQNPQNTTEAARARHYERGFYVSRGRVPPSQQ